MQVKVWNDDKNEYSEEFRGKMVVIPSGEFVLMGRSEANKFLSQSTGVIIDGAGRHTKPKMLRIEKPAEEFAELTEQPLKYTARDGKMFRTKVGLEEYEATLPEGLNADESGPKKRRKVQTLG